VSAPRSLTVLLERFVHTPRTRGMPEGEFRARSNALGQLLTAILAVEAAPVALEVLCLVLGRAIRLNVRPGQDGAAHLETAISAIRHHFAEAPGPTPSIIASRGPS